MAGEEVAEGSRTRRRMDLTLYLGLPPLPRPPGRLDAAFDCPPLLSNSAVPVPVLPDAPITDEPEELLTPEMTYSPSNALSTPDEQSMLDPIIYAWLNGHSTDGEEGTGPAEPAVVLSAPMDNANVSPPPPPPPPVVSAAVERNYPRPWQRFLHSSRVANGVEMIGHSVLRQSLRGTVDIEAMTPELRLQRVIQVSQQHNMVSSGLANHSQRATSPEADRLFWAIQRSHNSLGAARRQKLDVDDKLGGNKDGCCGCNSSFECNICLDTAKEPVVTPCGHLFCWPCLYQWLHAHSAHSECPVCKGEVLEVNVTPIYGRGGDERDSASLDMPPRPRANRMESLRQQLQMADTRGIATVVRQLIENQGIVRGQPNPDVGVEVTVVPTTTSRSRARPRRQPRQDNNVPPSIPAMLLNVANAALESGNQVPLPPSSGDSAAQAVPAAPQQSSSVEQPSTSSTTAVIVEEPGSSRRSRPSESTTPRRIRRRQQ